MKPRHFRYLLAIIVLVVFARACTNDFVGWDDNHTIYKNPAFNPPSLSAIMAFWSPKHPQAGLWIPVTYMVWGALAPIAHLDAPDASGSTLNPWIYHSANVVLHLATTLVVFELIRRMIRSDRAAFVGAILFAVHPIQVEPVCWASGLKDVLCGLLTISAAWQYLVFAETRQRKHFFIGMLLFILGMLSKPTAMVTPALAGALDLFITHRNWRLVARDLWPWFVLALPCLAWTKYFQPATGILTAPLWVRPLLVTDNLAFYLYKLIWPAQLSADYGHRPLLLMETGELYVTWPIPLAVAALLWRFRRKAPLLVLSAIIFVIGVLPVIGFTRFLFQYFSATADHYLYISMLGPALALAWVMTQPRASMRGARPYVIAILLIALSVRSFIQEGTWKDDLTLFNHTIEVNPDSFMGYQNRAATFDRMASQSAPEEAPLLKQRAMQDLERSVAIKPDYAKGHDSLAMLYIERGDIEKRRGETSKAQQDIETGIVHIKAMLAAGHQLPPELRGDVYTSDVVLGEVLEARGDLAGAEHCYIDALEDRHGDPIALQKLNNVRTKLATRPAATSQL
jgi:protein O-mannosyl-transferase